ncbi:hypothetical protein JTE90_023362 [Oedothorax gibbosus]|uniref:PH domain-containing protein n=1 Tax=Oedothorax gibbosus TaxID=931172 RepID=A0AAV6U9I9_9ARAC|nr:hypothetical protein JTE90_023362 [Oedothorax gibbosus]
MPCAPLLRFSDCTTDLRSEAGQVMSGVLEIIGGSSFAAPSGSPNRGGHRNTSSTSRPQRVFVRIYRTSSEHFAVLYPARAIVTACRPMASINLKSCTVKQLPNCILRVSPRSCEGMAVTFQGTETCNEVQMSEWLNAFSEAKDNGSPRRKKVSDHRLPLPVLVESEEDEGIE